MLTESSFIGCGASGVGRNSSQRVGTGARTRGACKTRVGVGIGRGLSVGVSTVAMASLLSAASAGVGRWFGLRAGVWAVGGPGSLGPGVGMR